MIKMNQRFLDKLERVSGIIIVFLMLTNSLQFWTIGNVGAGSADALTLESEDITFSNNWPDEGETITIYATVHNTDSSNPYTETVSFYDGNPASGGTLIGSDTITVPSGGEFTGTTTWILTGLAGYHRVYVTITNSINRADKGITITKWLAVDQHMHSDVTQHGQETMDWVATESESNGLDAIVFTHHSSFEYNPEDLPGQPDDVPKYDTITNNIVSLNNDPSRNIQVIRGTEWNFPGAIDDYPLYYPETVGTQHVLVYFPSTATDKVQEFIETYDEIVSATTPSSDEALTYLDSIGAVAFIAHPSLSNADPLGTEDYSIDLIKQWSSHSSFVGFAGSPGHQKTIVADQPGVTDNRYDVMTAEINNVWDQLLCDNIRFWTIANSDFHTESTGGLDVDYIPGQFSRTNILAPDNSWDNILGAYRSGAMWTVLGESHERPIDEVKFTLTDGTLTAGIGRTLTPGSSSVTVKIRVHSPSNRLKHIELIGNYNDPNNAESLYRFGSNPSDDINEVWTDEGGGYLSMEKTFSWDPSSNHPFYIRVRGADVEYRYRDTDPDPLYFYTNPIFIGGDNPSTPESFNMYVTEWVKEVGDSASTNTAVFDIELRNFIDSPNIVDLTYEWDYTNPSIPVVPPQIPPGWSASFTPSQVIIPARIPGRQPPIGVATLTVVAPVGSPHDFEDSPVPINIIGDSQIESYINMITVQTKMNSFDVDISCEDPYKLVLPGVPIDYHMTVTNEGKVDETFDLIPIGPPVPPAGAWIVQFYYIPVGGSRTELPKASGHPSYYDVGPLSPGASLDIIMKVSTFATDLKYYEGLFDVVADSINDGIDHPNINNGIAPVTTIITGLIFSISDEYPSAPHFYYENDFRGHNVNPASSTSFKMNIFKRQTGTYNVDLKIDSPLPDYWHYFLSPSLIHFDASEPIGTYRNATLTVTAPANSVQGNFLETIVRCEDPIGVESVKVKTKVTNDRKVYILNLDAVNPKYLDLARDGSTWTSGDERLMPNLWNLVETGSRYTGATDSLPAVTDNNHVGIITSTPTGVHGIPGVGAYYTGMDPSDNYPEISSPSPDLISDQGVETIYDVLDTYNSELRTGVIVGKNWVAELFNGDDCDIMAHGENHPYYMREPGWGKAGDYALGSDTDVPPEDAGLANYHKLTTQLDQQTDSVGTSPGKIARHFPTDKWVVDSTIEMIENEDPDFIYMLLANGDDAGHAYGHAWDPNVDPRTINTHANPEDLLDTMVEMDRQIGKFLVYLDQTNRYEDSIIVVTSDHAMTTHAQYREIDIKEYLLNKDIIMGRDYDFIFSEGSFIWLFGVNDVIGVESILETDFNNDFPGRLWDVLSKTASKNEQKDNVNLYDGKAFELFNQIYYNKNTVDTTTIKQPDIIIFTDTVTGTDATRGIYENVGYVDAAEGGANALNIDVDMFYIPREGRVPYLIGNHATWSEQHVFLIFHGLGIKQGYINSDSISVGPSTMDIMPTICQINSWPKPNTGNGKIAGSVLNDCLTTTTKITVSPDGIGDYATIQAAVTAANPGDVVFVTSKSIGGNQQTTVYKEPIIIGKSISLIADMVLPPMILGDRWDTPSTSYDIITITSSADHVKVKGFDISSSGNYGVYVGSGCDNNLIYGNSFSLNLFPAMDLGSNNRWYNGYFKGEPYIWWEPDVNGNFDKFKHYGGGNYWSGFDWHMQSVIYPPDGYLVDFTSGVKTSVEQPQSDPVGDHIIDYSYDYPAGNIEDWYPIWPEGHLLNKDSDWIINGYEVRNSVNIFLSGDLVITGGATMIIINSNLIMDSLYDGEHNIIIEEGGKLILSGSEIYASNPLFRYSINDNGGNGEIIQEFSDIRDVHPDSTFGRSENRIYYGNPLNEYTTLELQFSVGGGQEIAYLLLPKTTDVFYAGFDLTGELSGSSYPTNPTVDIGNDDIIEWSYTGQLTTTIPISDLNTMPIFEISVQDYLNNYQPDQNGLISIPISFTSISEGKLIITNIDVGNTDKWTWGEFSQSHVHACCYYHTFSVDMYYTGSGGIRIDDTLCPNIDYTNTVPDLNWGKSAKIKHHYYDEDNDGIIDGTSIAESTLQMYWWDENFQNWVPTSDVFGEENTGVRNGDNFVWTNVDHFSNFTTKGSYVPIEETEELIVTTMNMEIQEGIKNSLITKLDLTLSFLNDAQEHFINGELDLGNENLILAKDKLNDFINEVEAQRGKAIREQDAVILINDAQVIIDLIDEAIV